MADMAVLPATEGANLVWQRVNIALANASPAAKHAFRELKLWLATQKGNPPLRFTSLQAASGQLVGGLTTASTGALIGTADTTSTATVYGIYLKKGAGAASFFILLDEDDDAALSGLGAAEVLVLPSVTPSTAGVPSENVWIRPNGLAITNGLRAASVTTAVGLTIAAESASDNGFIVSGN